MANEKNDRSAIEIAVEHGIKGMTEQHIAAVPLQKLESDSTLIQEGKRAGSRIKRICAFLYDLEEKRKTAEQLLAVAMQEQFPELGGNTPVFYQGWIASSEELGARNGDLFEPVGLKAIVASVASRSTRSSDVNLGAVLHTAQ